MGKSKEYRMPSVDPISGHPLRVTELTCEESGVVIRGNFALSRWQRLTPEQEHFLETFLRCRGMISSVERELGLSYPTVRNRLDALLEALGLAPVREERPKDDRGKEEKPKKNGARKREILDQLERGEISAQEAKERLREVDPS